MSTENKLFDANEQISELKRYFIVYVFVYSLLFTDKTTFFCKCYIFLFRLISKLDLQVKQLEHENMTKSHLAFQKHLEFSGVG